MKYKEYKKLMSVPLKELSTNDQAKRNEEFQRRLNICKVFLTGIKNGYVSTSRGKIFTNKFFRGLAYGW